MAALSKESSLKGPAAAARARKRRIALRKKNTSMDEVIDGGAPPKRSSKKASDTASLLVDPVTNKPKPSITGIKKQSRYMPGVPMTKDELKSWRKEARRVRNRESAAASRRRNRDRTGVLEEEVDAMKSKYAAALKYILDLEAGTSNDSSSFFTPQVLRQDLMEARSTEQVPQVSCGTALTLNAVEQHEMECIGSGGIATHIMISRPTAVCVLIPP